MSRKSPLYDPNMINEDLRVRGLSMLAQLLFAKLAALANLSGGYIKIGTSCVSIERAAAATAFEGDIASLVTELEDMGLIVHDDDGWHIPEMKARQYLRDKRSRAGKNGGNATTAKRTDVTHRKQSNVVCLSKEKTKRKSNTYKVSAKKEKRTKKEKNNKYIYISDRKVLRADRGTEDNVAFLEFDNFRVYRRDYEALQLELPFFDEERIYELLDGHDKFCADKPWISEDNWHIPFMAGALKMHANHGGKAVI